jgi:hypothetical protein
MPDISERHEIRIRGRDHTIVFIADSQDGRLVIRQEPDGKKSKEVCAITLSDPDELFARSSKGCGEYCRRWDMQLSPVRRLPSLAERSHMRSLVAEKTSATPSSRRLVKGTR